MKSLIVLSLIFTWAAAEPPCLGIDILCELDNENHPAKECFAKMSTKIQESVKVDCLTHQGTPEFDMFRQNMEVICTAKGSPIGSVSICPFSFSTTPVDDFFCNFDDNNHPIHDCYNSMSHQIQKSVHDCVAYAATPLMENFMENIQVICNAKTPEIRPFELTEPTPPLDFQFCELDDDSHPVHDCYSLMSEQIQKSLKADCLNYMGTEAMEDLIENINVLCEAKKSNIRPNELTTPPFDVEFCELDDDSHPIHDCYSLMSEQIQKSLKADCLNYMGTEAMEDLIENINVICEAKKSNIRPNELTTPPFDVEFCELDDDSHPIHDCYSLMSEQIQKSLKADCLNYMGTEAMEDLIENINVICEAKKSNIRPNELTTATPEFDFDQCALEDDKHPIHDCYSLMSTQIQKSLKADCIANKGTPAFYDLGRNIEVLCKAKHSEIRDLELPTETPPIFVAECELDQEDHPIHDCYSQMSSQIQKSVKADCLAHVNTPEMDVFTKNIMLLCELKGFSGHP